MSDFITPPDAFERYERLREKNIRYIQSDVDYVGVFLFAEPATVDPTVIVEENSDPTNDQFAPQPPPISGYREADVQGMACWNCGHFTPTGDSDNDGVVDGICNLFEALADGAFTCDRFTPHADLFRQQPHTSWTEDMQNASRDSYDSRFDKGMEQVNYSDNAVLNEILFAGSEATEEDGLIWKDILRTGKWSHTPTQKGVVEKELRIVRDGFSDPANGVISLSEIYRNFNERAVPYVTVPLSDDNVDHKNIARVNTGYIRKLKFEEREGNTYLKAGFDFTEPDVKEKVLRGTIPDVSAGIPFGVTRRSDNRTFGAVLDHVCLTRKPFIDGLQPFGIAAADSEDLPVESWEQEETQEPAKETEKEDVKPTLSFRQTSAAIRTALTNQLRLGPEYQVDDVDGSVATISHKTSGASWTVAFRVDGETVIVASVDKWKLVEEQKETEQTTPEPVTASDLEQAHQLRELRLSQPTSNTGGIQMSVLSLDGVELSDEARAQIQSVLAENETLKRRNREAEVAERISELENKGLKGRPGALKFYRQIMLSDDGGPAVVLFSDEQDESKRERLTAKEVLDRFIAGLEADGGVVFSDQAARSGNDEKPPTDASGEKAPIDERLADANVALYGNKEGQQRRRTRRN